MAMPLIFMLSQTHCCVCFQISNQDGLDVRRAIWRDSLRTRPFFSELNWFLFYASLCVITYVLHGLAMMFILRNAFKSTAFD